MMDWLSPRKPQALPFGARLLGPSVRPQSFAAASEASLAPLPASIAFLAAFGVKEALLVQASLVAREQGIAPEAALLANGKVREGFFYRSLALWLGAAFLEGEAALAAGVRYPHAIHAGVAALAAGDGPLFVAAPRGRFLDRILGAAQKGEHLGACIAITTPSHLARLVRGAAAATIVRDATLGLASLDPDLSATTPPSEGQRIFTLMSTATAALGLNLAPQSAWWALSLSMTCLFLASIWLRLLAGAASIALCQNPQRRRAEDEALPLYSIVVALYREARVVPQLIAALEALDYPRGKLEIKLVIEQGDRETQRAIEALRLLPAYELVVAPPGGPRTKPRALNIALPLVRGEFLVVFDAEDRPHPGQLREAAERFRKAPPEPCLPASAPCHRQCRGFLAHAPLCHRIRRVV